MHWLLYKLWIIKYIYNYWCAIVKQGFNLKINNDLIIIVFIELLHLYKTENYYDWQGDYDLRRYPITAERGPIVILDPVL